MKNKFNELKKSILEKINKNTIKENLSKLKEIVKIVIKISLNVVIIVGAIAFSLICVIISVGIAIPVVIISIPVKLISQEIEFHNYRKQKLNDLKENYEY